MSPSSDWGVVVPTLGRPSLRVLLESLAAQRHRPAAVVVVDDRRDASTPVDVSAYPSARVLRGGGRGPAHARNLGWQALDAEWAVLVDDDVVLPSEWSVELLAALADAAAGGGGLLARLRVPLPG